MRLGAVLLFVIFLSGSILARQSPQLLFDQANTLLEENNFIDALNGYRGILSSGQESGALYLNMGIAAVQLDSLGLAKYYFLKAGQFSSTEYDAEIALEYVNSQFSRQSAVLPKLPWDKAVDSIKDGIGALGVFFIGFIFILIALSLLVLTWFKRITFKNQTPIIYGIGALSLIVVGLAFYVDYVDQRYSEAVIIVSETQVKQQPNEEADLVSLAYEGYGITIDNFTSESQEDWLYIRLGNGQYGWIKSGGNKTL